MFDYPMPREQLGRRLEKKALRGEFERLWGSLAHSYFQFERLQTYQEPNNPSYVAFSEGDVDVAQAKVKDFVEGDYANSLRDLCQKDVGYVRIHAVELPLTEYIAWEFLVYETLCRFGQRVLIAELEKQTSSNKLWNSYDFLLFDQSAVMVNDYGDDGILCGGWLTKDATIVEEFVALSEELRRGSVPFGEFQWAIEK